MKKVETQVSEHYGSIKDDLPRSSRTKGVQGKKRHFWIAKLVK